MRCSARLSLRSLLFPIYVNSLKDASKCLDYIMFADDNQLLSGLKPTNYQLTKVKLSKQK